MNITRLIILGTFIIFSLPFQVSGQVECVGEGERIESDTDICCKGLYKARKALQPLDGPIERWEECRQQSFSQKYGNSLYLIVLGLISSSVGGLILKWRKWYTLTYITKGQEVYRAIKLNIIARWMDNPTYRIFVDVGWGFTGFFTLVIGLILLVVGLIKFF